jgi:hypothetical protein
MENELLEKIFNLLEENRACSVLYKEEVEKKFVSRFLDFTERVLDANSSHKCNTGYLSTKRVKVPPKAIVVYEIFSNVVV